MKTGFTLDGDVVEKLVPNFDGDKPGESKTFTVFLKDGDSYVINCKSSQAGIEEGADEKIKLNKKYKDLKDKKDKEKEKIK